ncbi:MAG: PAS domain S-box protein [Desulfobulbaceae bacterium]|nr:PAS domain S-box protein [Desulfobulbaceae bacterium]
MDSQKIFSIVFVVIGALFMFFSITRSVRTHKNVPEAHKIKWKVMTTLMAFFLIGYLGFIGVELFDIVFVKLFVSLIFLAGGFFVFLVMGLSRQTIETINDNANEIAQFNEILLSKNKNLDDEISARKQAEIALQKANEGLDFQVKEKTAELQEALTKMEVEVEVRKRAENDIAESHAELDQILNTVTDGLRVIDNNFRIIRVNKTFERLTNLSEDKIIGKKCFDIFSGFTCQTADCPLNSILNGKKRVEREVEKKTQDGTVITFVITAIPYINAKGELIGIIETFHDISERKAMERSLVDALTKSRNLTKELETSFKELHGKNLELNEAYATLQKTQSHMLQQEKMASIGHLAAGMAHEINNPMGFVISNLNTLERYYDKISSYISSQEKILQEKKDGELFEKISEIRRKMKVDYVLEDSVDLLHESLDGAQRIKEIVQNLKSFSRVDKAGLTRENLNICIENTLKVINNELQYKCEVKKDLAEIPPVNCYPQQLNQAFTNLLLNASQSIDEKGQIIIKSWEEENFVCVSITDTGHGISEESLPHIFEPFFTTKDVGKGTGLGLSIVYDIVTKSHKGEIFVQSKAGQGAKFTIKIPK